MSDALTPRGNNLVKINGYTPDEYAEVMARLNASQSIQRVMQGQGTKAAFDLVPTGIQGRPQPPDRNDSSMQDAYLQNELVFACVEARTKAFSAPRLIVQKHNTDGTWSEIVGHPLRSLMLWPNDDMDEAGFAEAVGVSCDTVGRFYAEKVRSNLGAVVELHPLDPTKISPVPGAGNKVENYIFKDGSKSVTLKAEDVLVRMNAHPKSKWRGLSPVAVCLGTVDADSAQTDYVRAFFNNAGTPSGVLKVKGTYTQEQSDAVRAKWRERFGRNWGRQHDLAVLDDNAEYMQIGSDLNKLDSEIMRSISESRICMVFDVPPLVIYAYVGLLRSTYSNLKEAWSGFWESTLMPMSTSYASWLTRNLLPEFEGIDKVKSEMVRCAFDYTQVQALQENATELETRARGAFIDGGITLNELREVLKKKPDPAGDYYLRKLVFVATPYGADVSVGAAPSEAIVEPQKLLPPGRRTVALKASTRSRDAIQKAIQKDLEKYVVGQYEKAARAVVQ